MKTRLRPDKQTLSRSQTALQPRCKPELGEVAQTAENDAHHSVVSPKQVRAILPGRTFEMSTESL